MAKNKKISFERKSAVLAELALPGRTITEVAKNQGVSRSIIYAWTKEKHVSKIKKTKNIITPVNHNFIEVSVVDHENHKNSSLQKASFMFSDFSLIIEGNIGSARLLKILKNLGEIC